MVMNAKKLIEETTIFLDEAKVWLDDYFTGKNPDPSRLTLVPYGTAFQRKVWKVLVQIPYGVDNDLWRNCRKN